MKKERTPHVCPWWVGYLLLIPFRKFSHPPEQVLGPYVREGMAVLEVGPGMGYFTLTLARRVGPNGKVICVDIQEKMLQKLRQRAQKAGVLDRIVTIKASEQSLHIREYDGKIDFGLAFAMVHEVPDRGRLFAEIHRAMKPGALLLFSEPKGHVSKRDFEHSLALAQDAGLRIESTVEIRRSLSILLKKWRTSAPSEDVPSARIRNAGEPHAVNEIDRIRTKPLLGHGANSQRAGSETRSGREA